MTAEDSLRRKKPAWVMHSFLWILTFGNNKANHVKKKVKFNNKLNNLILFNIFFFEIAEENAFLNRQQMVI